MYTVLLVDDEQCILQLCSDVLARTRRLHILQASSGREAIDAASKYDGAIQLLISDIMMPGILGVELAECLTVSRPEMKVLLVSGNSFGHWVMKPGWRFWPNRFVHQNCLSRFKQFCRLSSL
jgi:YesN/AraC family two-component response regulator